MKTLEIKKLVEKVVLDSLNNGIIKETSEDLDFDTEVEKIILKIKDIRNKYFSKSNTYEVQKGDSLSKIAKNNNVSLQDLVDANPQIKDVNVIKVGDKVNIPNKEAEKSEKKPSIRDTVKDEPNMEAVEVAKYIDWQHPKHKKRFLNNKDIWPAVVKAANKYNLKKSFLLAMIHTESGFNRTAVSNRGAKGLIQIMPDTWAELGGGDPFNTERNIELGAKYIRQILDWVPKRIRSLPGGKDLNYKTKKGKIINYSDEHIALTSYHTGMGRVRRVIERNGVDGYRSLESVIDPDYMYADKTLKRQKRYKATDAAVA